jgi:hypothetical protein
MEARVVFLASGIVALRHDLGSRLAKLVHTTHVIDVALREHDVAERPAIDGLIEPLVGRR